MSPWCAFRKSYATPGSHHPTRRNRRDCPNGHHGTRRHLERRPRPGPALPGRGRAGIREDHAGHAVPDRGRPPRRAGPLHHAVGNSRGTELRSPSRTAGTSPASRSASCCRQTARSNPTSSTRCTTPPRSSWRRRPSSILEDVQRLKPTRVVFDSLSELRLVAGNPLRYRRQILALKQYFAGPAVHGDPARRHDGGRSRSARPEHRARRDPAAAPQPRVRRRAPAPARGQVPRQRVPRRLSRLLDQARAASRCSRG